MVPENGQQGSALRARRDDLEVVMRRYEAVGWLLRHPNEVVHEELHERFSLGVGLRLDEVCVPKDRVVFDEEREVDIRPQYLSILLRPVNPISECYEADQVFLPRIGLEWLDRAVECQIEIDRHK